MGKNYMAKEKEKKRKEIIKEMTLSKDNKFVFIGDLEYSNPLLNSKTKT